MRSVPILHNIAAESILRVTCALAVQQHASMYTGHNVRCRVDSGLTFAAGAQWVRCGVRCATHVNNAQ